MADDFDVLIVGSGAAGGMAAYDFALAGFKVLMLEAGRDYDPLTETPMFQSPQEAPLRGAATTVDKPAGFYDATVDGGWKVAGEPYSSAPGSQEVTWWRPRMLGGRTNHWGRVSLRFGQYDFKPNARDGLGFDWPVTYEDIAPWYDRVERLIGVTGVAQGLENTPDSPPGILLDPPPPRAHEIVLSRAFAKLGMPVAPIHAAILTREYNGRAPCVFATPCTRGCSSRSNFQSTTVLIPAAVATGNLTVRTNAIVHRVETNGARKATGVIYTDRITGERHTASAKVIVLAAGAWASTRILLSSATAECPLGVGGSSGLLGKYILDTLEFTMSAHIPALSAIPPQNDDGMFTPHIYVPWWLYRQQHAGELDFPRGYHIEPRGGRRMPTVGVGNYVGKDDRSVRDALREKIKRKYGTFIFLSGEGEMIPNDQTFCELDTNLADKWGFPALKFHWQWGEAEVRQHAHMVKTFKQVFELLGTKTDNKDPMPAGGSAIHEVGGARMGVSAADSVLDQFGQCWDVPNVFVLDGASFVSSPDKNPTLTILALAARGADRIAGLLRAGDL